MMGFCDKVQKLVEGQLNDDPKLRVHYFLRQTFTTFANSVDNYSPGESHYFTRLRMAMVFVCKQLCYIWLC